MRIRRAVAAALLSITLLGSACLPQSHQSQPTSDAQGISFFAPGVAPIKLAQLVAAAGSGRLLQVTLRVDQATVAVLEPTNKVSTWSFRDGVPTQVDGDAAYVGQATFRLHDFDLSNVRGMCLTAREVSGSQSDQEVQIVEYSGGNVYMTVTTRPESQTVFFRADAVLVPQLTLTDPAGVRSALADVSGTATPSEVTAVGYSPQLGIWTDRPTADSTMTRAVRPARFPARSEVRQNRGESLRGFDPRVVDPTILSSLINRYGPTRVSIVAEIRPAMREPTFRVEASGRTWFTDLAGNDITATIAER